MNSLEKLREACGKAQWYQIVREAAWMYPPELNPQTVALLLDCAEALWHLKYGNPPCFCDVAIGNQMRGHNKACIAANKAIKALDEHLG